MTGSQRGEPALSRIDYSYDLSGNRTGKIKDNTTQYSYSTDANSNRLQSQSGAQTVSYSYDLMGNLTGDGRFTHSYNSAGRRIATTDTATGQTVNYGYDAIGQRVTKTNGGNTTQYFYDEQGHLTGEYDATGQLIQEIIWLGDLPVAVLKPTIPASATTDIYYIHADHLGTPRKITRPNDSKIVWTWESEAFGNSLPDQNPSGLGDFVFNLRFPGQYYDAETGLFYNYFRDYDSKTGRYIESDPIGQSGGVNTYTYVRGNPIRWADSKGLCLEDACIIEGTILITAGQAIVDGLTFGLGGGMIADSLSDKVRRNQEHQAYKDFADQGYSKTGDPCKDLRNKIDHHEQLYDMKEQWDKNWPHPKFPSGRHFNEIQLKRQEIAEWKKQYDEMCPKKCP
ncbi:MAG: hypothetical protein EPN17_15155 [Methylobacter sp.]|nr:MAG: hypothetical protein EPN17_15155 [Methylobacter sp.]